VAGDSPLAHPRYPAFTAQQILAPAAHAGAARTGAHGASFGTSTYGEAAHIAMQADAETVSSCDQSGLTDAIGRAGNRGTVQFTSDCTITLSSTIALSQSVTIDGNGYQVTISGGNAVQVFEVNPGVNVTLNDLTIADGVASADQSGNQLGGGIYNSGMLTVSNSTFTGNSTGSISGSGGAGIYSTGVLTVTDSTFTGNTAGSANGGGAGGGIYSSGTLTVSDSDFTDNTAGGGAGIANTGTLTVTDSNISQNDADGIANLLPFPNPNNIISEAEIDDSTIAGNRAGGIINDGTLTVTNSTISGNTSPGGIYSGGTATVTNSTFYGNSGVNGAAGGVTGGTYGGGPLYLANTILADSISGGDCGGYVVDHGGNLADDSTCGFTQSSSENSSADLNLGQAADNGGPLVGAPASAEAMLTYELLPGSAAIGATSCVLATDQRGQPRPDDGETTCDSGAIELQENAVPPAPVSPSTCNQAGLVNAIVAAGYDGTVQFTADCSITLSSTITLRRNVTIDGNGHQVTISGGHTAQMAGVEVFSINSGVNVTLNDLTISNGNATNSQYDTGGGVQSYGTLTITNCTFSNNTAGGGGAIFASDLTVSNSLFFGNSAGDGGAIADGGTITNSVFVGNSASIDGGAIFGDGTITGSTFSGNSAGNGGVIYNLGTTTFTNSTLSQNTAAYGGAIENAATLTVTNSTFSGNSAQGRLGGGIANYGNATLTNTILADPIGGDCGPYAYGLYGYPPTDGGGNLDSDGTCGFTQSTSRSNVTSLGSTLGPLADNGGLFAGAPGRATAVQSIALLPDSPAINAATCLQSTDQRGLPRPDPGDTVCDSGAVEVQLSTTSPTPTPTPAADNTVAVCDEPTLRRVIAAAVPGSTVTFACSGAITLTNDGGGPIILSKNLTIDGSGQAVTISGGHSVQVFVVNAGASVGLNSITIADGHATNGGGIDNEGALTVTNSTLTGNSAASVGGGICDCNYNGGTLTITNSTFSHNTAQLDGGGIDNNYHNTLTITDSTFNGNSAAYQGGAINAFGTTTITSTTFSGNTATTYGGGAIYFEGALTVSDSTFSDNSAAYGGGIVDTGSATVTNSTFSGNSAANGEGGGIANYDTLTVTNSTFSGNTATAYYGGGIYGYPSSSATLTNTILAGSTPGGDCYGIFTDNAGNIADDNTCGFSAANHSLAGTDPQLDPNGLQNNGGPTQTIALLPGSVAIDAATCLQSTDQRGFPRPDSGDSACDSGAYEVQAGPASPTTTATYTGTPTDTATNTATATSTPTATATSSDTATGTNTRTATATPSSGTILYPRLDLAHPPLGTLPASYHFGLWDAASSIQGPNAKSLATASGSAQQASAIGYLYQAGDASPSMALDGEFLSAPLAAQTIPAGAWSVGLGIEGSLLNAGAPDYTGYLILDLINGSTGRVRATLIDAPIGTEKTREGSEVTAYQAAVQGAAATVQAGDYLEAEIGVRTLSYSAVQNTTLFTGGTTAITSDGVATTDADSYIQAPTVLAFQ
jgi:predicted outer membrane repeat protein